MSRRRKKKKKFGTRRDGGKLFVQRNPGGPWSYVCRVKDFSFTTSKPKDEPEQPHPLSVEITMEFA